MAITVKDQIFSLETANTLSDEGRFVWGSETFVVWGKNGSEHGVSLGLSGCGIFRKYL